jgi:hypothetical protein
VGSRRGGIDRYRRHCLQEESRSLRPDQPDIPNRSRPAIVMVLWIEQARSWFDTMWQTISYEPAG